MSGGGGFENDNANNLLIRGGESYLDKFEDEDDYDEAYDSYPNLLYETIYLSSKASQQVNLTRVAVEQLIVPKWMDVQRIVWDLFNHQYRRENQKRFQNNEGDEEQ